jgi:hypothetical protein
MLTKTTELDAVNIMLSTIGESPINSIAAVSGFADAVIAKQILAEISMEVQENGWHFNTEIQFDLTPAFPSKEIFIPENCIEVDAEDTSIDVSMRGNRLYDRINHTYEFAKTLRCNLVLLMPFEEIPQAARHYITIRASRVFQQRVVGSQLLGAFTEKDEMRALVALRRFESKTADHNMLTGNYAVMRILNR